MIYLTRILLYRLIDYCLAKIRVVQLNGVKPLMVFDGAKLAMKQRIEVERTKQRDEARQKGHEMLLNGDVAGANKKFIESIEINPDIVRLLILELQ